jgi:hypothetical protein
MIPLQHVAQILVSVKSTFSENPRRSTTHQRASKDENARPIAVMGTMSPYPRDVIVSMAHQEHVPMLENTSGCAGFSRKKLDMQA